MLIEFNIPVKIPLGPTHPTGLTITGALDGIRGYPCVGAVVHPGSRHLGFGVSKPRPHAENNRQIAWESTVGKVVAFCEGQELPSYHLHAVQVTLIQEVTGYVPPKELGRLLGSHFR